MLTHDDDATIHQAGEVPEWRESFYVNFADTESRFYGAAWQGLRPNVGVAEATFLLFDRKTARVRSVDTALQVPGDSDRRSLGNQRFECIDPWSHWRVHYEDDAAKLQIDWRQTTATIDHDPTGTPGQDVDGELPEDEASFYRVAKHFEATGTIDCVGEIDGEPIAFTGFGTRDRAWGPRNYGLLRFMWWQTVQFPDGDAVHVMLLRDADDAINLFGMLHRDGRSLPATIAEVDVAYDDAVTGAPVSGSQRFVDVEGRELVITGMEPMHVAPMTILADGTDVVPRRVESPDEKVYFWTWQRFVRSDGVVGHGMVDQAYWQGLQQSRFASTAATGRLYDFGLTEEPAR
ncbi:hypothetical protein AB0L40_09260 [Patulibacter sp. NPDC049589]|uniref:DUF7065 domain-containing protein n=1 Tax=Patulibacter sp. NPDC049589 TaxID=3154731 RepID=UPI00342A85F7